MWDRINCSQLHFLALLAHLGYTLFEPILAREMPQPKSLRDYISQVTKSNCRHINH